VGDVRLANAILNVLGDYQWARVMWCR
jgi:hypothetical protein